MTLLSAFVFGVALTGAPAAAPGETSAERPPSESQSGGHIDPIVLDVEGPDPAQVRDAIALRLPERTVLGHGQPRPDVELLGYLQVRPSPEGDVAIALILVDRRAYYRTVSADPDLVAREVASTLANLIAGIEAGQLPPDETNVALPQPEPDPDPNPDPDPDPGPAPDTEPLPPTWNLGLALAPTLVLAIGPPSPQGLAAGGAAIRLDLRHHTGAFATADVRATGRANAGFGLARFRIGLGGGWAWRRGAFELVTAALLDFEPAWVREGGERVPLVREEGSDRQTAFLLGGHVRVVPTWRKELNEGFALRLGPFVELAGSGLPDAGTARIRTRTQTEAQDVFRVGGFELSTGLELGLWWGVP